MELISLKLGLCWLICFFPTVESIVFELNDLDLDRIIFEFQSNLKMTCNASEFVDPVIVIRHDGMDVTDLGDSYIVVKTPTAIELTISQVTSAHNGLYECMVTGRSVMIVRPLMINVITPRSVCLQSEVTLLKAEGEKFTLYCYFPWFSPTRNISPYNYIWHVRNGIETTQLTGPSDIVPGSVKGVIITSIGPLDVTDSGSTYICDHPLPVGQVPCEIGPIIVEPARTSPPPTDSTTNQAPTEQLGKTEGLLASAGPTRSLTSDPAMPVSVFQYIPSSAPSSTADAGNGSVDGSSSVIVIGALVVVIVAITVVSTSIICYKNTIINKQTSLVERSLTRDESSKQRDTLDSSYDWPDTGDAQRGASNTNNGETHTSAAEEIELANTAAYSKGIYEETDTVGPEKSVPENDHSYYDIKQ